jgi:hypothetical protein
MREETRIALRSIRATTLLRMRAVGGRYFFSTPIAA